MRGRYALIYFIKTSKRAPIRAQGLTDLSEIGKSATWDRIAENRLLTFFLLLSSTGDTAVYTLPFKPTSHWFLLPRLSTNVKFLLGTKEGRLIHLISSQCTPPVTGHGYPHLRSTLSECSSVIVWGGEKHFALASDRRTATNYAVHRALWGIFVSNCFGYKKNALGRFSLSTPNLPKLCSSSAELLQFAR